MDATFIIGSGNNRTIVDRSMFEKCVLFEQAYKFKPRQILAVGKACGEMFDNVSKFIQNVKELFITAVVDPFTEMISNLTKLAEKLFKHPYNPSLDDYFKKQVFGKPCNITCNYDPKISKRKAWFTMARRRM